MSPARVSGLYAITPDTTATDDLVERTAAILAGGARVLQYRNKSRDVALRRRQAIALQQLCQQANALFIINDDWSLALEVAADGVHVGEEDGDLGLLRQRCPDLLIGVSCYNALSLAEAASAAGADYVAFGSFFPSRTKPLARRADLPLLAQAHRQLPCPVVAIGGITRANAAPLIAAGADAVAVISDLYEAADPFQAAQTFAAMFHLQKDRT